MIDEAPCPFGQCDGSGFVIEGDPYDMLECNFVKPGKGQALYKCRLRNLLKNTIIDRTYKSGDGLEAADVRKGEAQFLYRDKSSLVFMDQESFEQYTIAQEVMGEAVRSTLKLNLKPFALGAHAGRDARAPI